jgi:hypothetical protein
MRIRGIFVLPTVVATMLALLPAPPASSATRAAWAPAATAHIHPGVMTFTGADPATQAQCTSNFVFADADNVYLGQAAHCAGTGAATDTNGCTAASLPLGTRVDIDGATRPGTLVYSSWLTMQARGETDPDACSYNDFALVRIDPADVGSVNPSLPFWGGPVGLGDGTDELETVYSYGNSSLRLGLSPLSPKYGTSLGTTGNGRAHVVYTVTPGIPGDSGSGFLDSQGRAIGVLSTVELAPLAASNTVADLASALAYLRTFSTFTGVQLVNGTEPFNPAL